MPLLVCSFEKYPRKWGSNWRLASEFIERNSVKRSRKLSQKSSRDSLSTLKSLCFDKFFRSFFLNSGYHLNIAMYLNQSMTNHQPNFKDDVFLDIFSFIFCFQDEVWGSYLVFNGLKLIEFLINGCCCFLEKFKLYFHVQDLDQSLM